MNPIFRFVVVAFATFICQTPGSVQAQEKYSPDSPEVERMVRNAISYLESSRTNEIGPVAMQGLAICEAIKRYENRIPIEHPMVQAALVSTTNYTLDSKGESFEADRMYEACVASIFLGVVDAEKYEPNIQAVLRLVERRQTLAGTWRYKVDPVPQPRGDTSQTQYCCLALWAANNHGIAVNKQVAAKALEWLINTQTASGGWVYRSQPGQQGAGGESLSISAAGAGGVYMLLDVLNAKSRFGAKRGKRGGADLPEFVTEYVPGANDNAEEEQNQIEVPGTSACTSAANSFFGANFVPNPSEWTYYFLYGFERYAYFRELADGQVAEIPDWYDQGVEFLKSTQGSDGSWRSQAGGEGTLPTVTTAFAVLFLVRSTELLANSTAKGSALGGTALPIDNKLELKGSRIETEAIVHSVDDFLNEVDRGATEEIEKYRGSFTTLLLPSDPSQRELKCRILRNLVTDEDAYKRLAAVKALSSVRDLNNVPALILALKDEEDEIKIIAHKGLRFISRKLDSIDLPEQPSQGDFETARRQWVEWYKSVRPDDTQVFD